MATSEWQAWRRQAACRNVPTEEMFPHEQNKQAVEEIKEVCSYCPVINECLLFADSIENTYRGTFGIYGGLTPSERIERRNAIKAQEESCPKPGRLVGVQRHRFRDEPLCRDCKAWVGRREAEQKRWAYAKELIVAGYNRYEVTKLAGVHKVTVDRLRRELADASLNT